MVYAHTKMNKKCPRDLLPENVVLGHNEDMGQSLAEWMPEYLDDLCWSLVDMVELAQRKRLA